MADEQIQFKLDLDSVDFLEKGLQAKGVIETIGDKENLTGLIEALTETTAILGTVGVAAFSLKKAIDFTVEAEGIQKIQSQFEALAEQSGVNGEELKAGLEKAAQGLIPTNDLLRIANEKMVSMGESADQLPDIMDLALKATQVYGGDATENFENISTAIANGNQRMLKHYGIIIDTQKAMKDYADANDLAENSLSKAGKTQAILNAALAQGKENFSGVEVDLGTATNTIKLLSATMTELKETFLLVFEKTMGPTVRGALGLIKDFATQAKTAFQATFGEGLEQNNAQIVQVQDNIKKLTDRLVDLKAKQGGPFDFAPGDTPLKIQEITNSIKKNQDQLVQLQKTHADLTKSEVGDDDTTIASDKKKTQLTLQNQQTIQANKIKTQKEILKSEQDALKQSEKNIDDFADVQKTIDKNEELQEKQHQLAIQEIQNSTFTNAEQKRALIAKENEAYAEKEQATERDEAAFRKKLLDEYVKNSDDAFDGIARAFQAHAQEAKDQLTDWGKFGEDTFSSIQSAGVTAFTQIGASIAAGKNVAESVAQAMLKAFLGVIAERAIAEGSLLLLSGVWPPNPVALGAGAGLIALGGALTAVSGTIGSSSVSAPATSAVSSGVSSSGSISGGSTSALSSVATPSTSPQTVQPTTVGNDQSQLIASQQATDQANLAAQQQAIATAATTEQTNEQNLAAAALASQQAAQAAITSQNQAVADQLTTTAQQTSDAAAAAAALQTGSATTTNSSQLAADQSVADTATTTAQRQKVVQIHIEGNYMETDQTRRQLMELIRQETDATDFSYNKIGV